MKDNTDITSAGIEIYRHDINYYADEYIKNELEIDHVDQESKKIVKDSFVDMLFYISDRISKPDNADIKAFYSPKRKQLNKHGLIQAMQDLEDDKLDILSISMPPGTQKCQPLYSKILTPNGFIQMGDVKVGTKVISGTGKVATVLSISPRKKRKMYEVTFDDGSKTRCSDNHLWTVQTRDDRRRKNKDGKKIQENCNHCRNLLYRHHFHPKYVRL